MTQILQALRQKCMDAEIFVHASEAEWAALVVAEGARYRMDTIADGMEYAGCMVIPPWMEAPKIQKHTTKTAAVSPIRNPIGYANAMLAHAGHSELLEPKWAR